MICNVPNIGISEALPAAQISSCVLDPSEIIEGRNTLFTMSQFDKILDGNAYVLGCSSSLKQSSKETHMEDLQVRNDACPMIGL